MDHTRALLSPTIERRQLLALAGGTIAAGLPSLSARAAEANPKAVEIQVTSAGGHKMACWRAQPVGKPKGGVVTLHAIYGRTKHMGDVCERWAAAGFTCVAPAFYDRIKPNLTFAYNDTVAGNQAYMSLNPDLVYADIEAAKEAAGPKGTVAISGFCTGGSWAWRTGARSEWPAQVNFYGSHIASALMDLSPKCPTILHFGDADRIVPMADIEKIRAKFPQVELHIYPGAGHAFENVEQVTYDKSAGDISYQRSFAFLEKHLKV